MASITHRRALAAASVLTVSVIALAACSSGADDEAEPAADLEIGSVDLSEACPATIVVQTDWNPESEHGHLYEMLGDDYTIDADAKSVSGPLLAGGEYTGVNLEVRSGGPAVGYSPVQSLIYQDEDITLGYVHSDAAIASSATTPVVGVLAQLDVNPQMVMWDPETYPDADDIPSLVEAMEGTGGVWRYFGGATYMEYLIASGVVPEELTDGGYDGTPAGFVTDGGASVQQGFASAEPYTYEHEVPEWGKPVEYALISSTGWDIYGSALSVRADRLEELSPCFEQLVPVMQQALVDFVEDPSDTIDLILEAVDAYDNGWIYSDGVAEYAVETMLADGIVSNGDNEYVGDFDPDRVSAFFEIGKELFTETAADVDPDLTAEDIYTNDFLDTSIGLSD
ncbi:ABC transporter substrate-binding protein [Microbacterium marinilacus]|uniref:Nitrate ABC transporter substrate-binding protein n=1 Tax=Microbacterium marinilacus TaxID=415209 RepID=A0ABP7BEB8_9MICO|nr:ABC transporter substrate-binding protein [Microbacterium marinilacus]MBY0688893.1 ABC transporter substrate-binding protein [Microbacterium marinilacus]